MKNIVLVLAALGSLTGCASMYTQSPISKSTMLQPGMTREQVQEVMGPPVKSEFSGNIQAWHYCKTGYMADEFIVMFFSNGILKELQNYYVTLAETAGASGDCSKFIRRIEYRPADSVNEIRIR